jgi:DNA-binding NarL/FixJ family response regulator
MTVPQCLHDRATMHQSLTDGACRALGRAIVPGLTTREACSLDDVRATILEHLASGLTKDVIARRLGMSPRTCRQRLSILMSKLKATSRFQAGAEALRAGLL